MSGTKGEAVQSVARGIDSGGRFVVRPWLIAPFYSAGSNLLWRLLIQVKSWQCVDRSSVLLSGVEGAGLGFLLRPGGLIRQDLKLVEHPGGRDTFRWLKLPHINIDFFGKAFAENHLFFPDPPIAAGAALGAASEPCNCQ